MLELVPDGFSFNSLVINPENKVAMTVLKSFLLNFSYFVMLYFLFVLLWILHLSNLNNFEFSIGREENLFFSFVVRVIPDGPS